MPVALWNAPKGFDTRGHPDHQPCHVIALRLKGALVQRIDDSAHRAERLRPNGFSVHPAHRDLRFVATSSIRFAHLYVTEPFFRRVASGLGAPKADFGTVIQIDRVMYEDDEITGAVKAYITRAFDGGDRPTRFEMESRANLIALRLLQRHWFRQQAPRSPGGEMAPWQVRRICTHLEQNLDRTVSLEELSELVDRSAEHTCRAFRRTTGVPPLRWQAQKRMEVACRLLIDTDASLTSIAQQVGYAGQSAFGAVFRKLLGVSPGRYRSLATEGGAAAQGLPGTDTPASATPLPPRRPH
ncbi:helix-turn-helix domain-containing protein [Amorphus sp. MBR-141]|jgi:AraC family transcriptional regulator